MPFTHNNRGSGRPGSLIDISALSGILVDSCWELARKTSGPFVPAATECVHDHAVASALALASVSCGLFPI